LKLAEKLELRPDLAVGHLDYAKLLSEKSDNQQRTSGYGFFKFFSFLPSILALITLAPY